MAGEIARHKNWQQRRSQGQRYKRFFWNALYYSGRIFSFGFWSPIFRDFGLLGNLSDEFCNKIDVASSDNVRRIVKLVPLLQKASIVMNDVVIDWLVTAPSENLWQLKKTLMELAKSNLLNIKLMLFFANFHIDDNKNIVHAGKSSEKRIDCVGGKEYAFFVKDLKSNKVDQNLFHNHTTKSYIEMQLKHRDYISQGLFDTFIVMYGQSMRLDQATLNMYLETNRIENCADKYSKYLVRLLFSYSKAKIADWVNYQSFYTRMAMLFSYRDSGKKLPEEISRVLACYHEVAFKLKVPINYQLLAQVQRQRASLPILGKDMIKHILWYADKGNLSKNEIADACEKLDQRGFKI